MRKYLLFLSLIATAVIAVEPAVHKNRYVGVVLSYVSNSGTNSVIELGSSTNTASATLVPYRLSNLSATTNGVATAVKAYRVWNYSRDYKISEVTTNFFGNPETNTVHYGDLSSYQTNLIYDSASDTLPVSEWILDGEILRLDFQSVTGVTCRVVGTSQ